MRCNKCGSLEDKVVDSRTSKDGRSTRRRRECDQCGHRYTTHELIEPEELFIIKRSGAREPLVREKLLGGMVKACEKRPVSLNTLEQATNEILGDLAATNQHEIESRKLGLLVMQKLGAIDSVAYVRYASVYRQFKEVGEFIDEIRSLERWPDGYDPLQPELFPIEKKEVIGKQT